MAQGCKILAILAHGEVRPRSGVVLRSLFPLDEARGVGGEYHYGLHPHTVEQALLALTNRHLGDSGPYNQQSVRWLARFVNEWVQQIGVQATASFKQIVQHRSGNTRRRFFLGYVDLQDNPGRIKNFSRVTAMPKLELHPTDTLADKEDRIIQCRQPAYNVALARYLHPIEDTLYGSCWYINSNRVRIIKCASPYMRAKAITYAWGQFIHPLAYLADHSRFDRAITVDHIEIEHMLYEALHQDDRYLAKLLSLQLRNIGRLKEAAGETQASYKIEGKRMSGDLNTALGNSIINVLVLAAYFKNSEIFVDGDDSVVVLDADARGHNRLVFQQHCRRLGFDTKVELARRLEEVEFCQSRIVQTELGPQFVRNPHKIMETIGISAKRIPANQREAIFQGKLLCEAVCNVNIPIISYLGWYLRSDVDPQFEDVTAKHIYEQRRTFWVDEPPCPTPDTRASFALAWGISIDRQHAYEKAIMRMALPSVPLVIAPSVEVGVEALDVHEDYGTFEPMTHEIYCGTWPLDELVRSG